MRIYALCWAAPLILTAAGIIVELRSHNPEHYDRLMDFWWVFGLSFVLFVGTVYFIWKRKSYGIAFGLLIRSISLSLFRVWYLTLSLFALSISHYLRWFYKRSDGHFINHCLYCRTLLLIPSLILLLRLFLFNKNYVEGKQVDNA